MINILQKYFGENNHEAVQFQHDKIAYSLNTMSLHFLEHLFVVLLLWMGGLGCVGVADGWFNGVVYAQYEI